MASRDLDDVRAEIEGGVASCERLLQELADDLRFRTSERENALKFLSQTREELEKLEAQELRLTGDLEERTLSPL